LAANIEIRQRIQVWQVTVCAVVCAYLALGAATHSIRFYHWFILAAIPAVFVAGDRGRRFFLDWSPLFAFWMVYDRLRLAQPLLYSRVAVEWPYYLESWLFGWMTSAEVPAHAAREWLAANLASPAGSVVGWSAQVIYFSYLFILPFHLAFWWWKGRSQQRERELFVRHLSAFSLLHVMAMLLYVILPVAPPWWITLHGMVQPTADLVAQTNMSDAMYGVVVQRMIKNAAQWFGAVPSLHAAYPMLFFMLSFRRRSSSQTWMWGIYSIAMCVTTVVLNQHYIIDLIAAVVLAAIACLMARRVASVLFPEMK
jgi:membrane-associated phospholipid phosphatase